MTDINYDEVSDEAIQWVSDLNFYSLSIASIRKEANAGFKYYIALMHHAYLVQTFTPEVLRDRYERAAIKVLTAWHNDELDDEYLADRDRFKSVVEILKAEFAERDAG